MVLLFTELLSKPDIYWQQTQRGSKRRKSKYVANKNVSGWSEMTKTKQGEERQKEEQKNYVGNYTGISKIQLQKTLHEKITFFLALGIENTNQTEKLIFCDRDIEDHLPAK